jgi:hypothetical protein
MGFKGSRPDGHAERGINSCYARGQRGAPRGLGSDSASWPNIKRGLGGVMALGQACPPEYQGAQCAFKDSMIH